MLDSFGESRLRTLGLGKGTPEALKELGQLTGYLRHHLSSAVIWANVRCLLYLKYELYININVEIDGDIISQTS